MTYFIFFSLSPILPDVYENQKLVSYKCLMRCNYMSIKDIYQLFNKTLVRHYKTLQKLTAVSYYLSGIYSSVLLSCDKIVCKVILSIQLQKMRH